MIHEPARAVTLHADLTLDLDDQPVAITADGRDVTVRVADLAHALRAVATVPLPPGAQSLGSRRLLRNLADGSARNGLQARVLTPHGAVLTVGRDVRSTRLTRLVTGTRHVAVDHRGLRPLWRPGLRLLADRVRHRRRG